MRKEDKPAFAPVAAFIGTLLIDPGKINADSTYVVECPKGTKFLTLGMIDGTMVLWVLAPQIDATERFVLRVVPGGQMLAGSPDLMHYIGSAIVVRGDAAAETYQDWHVFHDYMTHAPLEVAPQFKYMH